MIPAAPGTVAVFDVGEDRSVRSVTLDVIAWDDNGEALIVDIGGLITARSLDGFLRLEKAVTQHIDADFEVVQLIPGGGWVADVQYDGFTRTGPVVAWALCRDGVTRPVVHDGFGIAEVLYEERGREEFTVRHPDELGAMESPLE